MDKNKNEINIIEFVGTSGVGKSHVFNKLQKKLHKNEEVCFHSVSSYSFLEMINLRIFLTTMLQIARCSIRFKYFLKYLKFWYVSQIKINKWENSTYKYIFLDVGPFHRMRSIRRYSNKESTEVRRILLRKSTLLPNIVIILEATAGEIYERRIKKDNERIKKLSISIEEIKKENNSLTNGSLEDIGFANNIHDVKLLRINNAKYASETAINRIIKELGI